MSYAEKLLEYANEYHRALSTLAGARETINPVGYLAAHTLELAFKSYLSFYGYDLSKLKKIKHDIVSLWNECQQCGLTLPGEIPIGVLVLSQNNGAKERYPYRYPHEEDNVATVVPDIHQIADAVLEILESVEHALSTRR
jgi:hypothetical protein